MPTPASATDPPVGPPHRPPPTQPPAPAQPPTPATPGALRRRTSALVRWAGVRLRYRLHGGRYGRTALTDPTNVDLRVVEENLDLSGATPLVIRGYNDDPEVAE